MEPDDAGRAMRNERYLPAYVRVVEPFEDEVAVGKIVGLDNNKVEIMLSSAEGRSGVGCADEEDEGRFGKDEVRSKPLLFCSSTDGD